jgi:hypothetical protein
MSKITGIPNNNSLILDGCDYLGKDASIESNQDYSGGTVAVCNIGSGEVFNSGWIPAPTLSGVYEILPVFDTDMELDFSANIVIYRRDNTGTISQLNTPLKLFYESVYKLRNNLLCYFDGNYDYMITIITVDGFVGSVFNLDYVQMLAKGISNPLLDSRLASQTSDGTGFAVQMQYDKVDAATLDMGNGEQEIYFGISYIARPSLTATVQELMAVAWVKNWIMDSTNTYYIGVNVGVWDFFDSYAGSVPVSVHVVGMAVIPVY